VNNKALEQDILAHAAKYSTRYEVKLFGLAIEGNHIQFPALFQKGNRAHFMRDFNSSVARAIPRYQPNFGGGRFWARRYSAEYLPGDEDIEEQFFYTVLQPVQDGLVDKISDYPGYNCFYDAISGTKRKFKLVRWKDYNDARRWGKTVSIEAYTDEYELCYTRLPGYEKLSQKAYMDLMKQKLAARTQEVIQARGGKKALGAKALRQVKPGSIPKNTKTSTINDHRPRVLSQDPVRRADAKDWYFSIYYDYKEASKQYRMGKSGVRFPKGTYKPPLFTVAFSGTM
jgi:hypothetical protein